MESLAKFSDSVAYVVLTTILSPKEINVHWLKPAKNAKGATSQAISIVILRHGPLSIRANTLSGLLNSTMT